MVTLSPGLAPAARITWAQVAMRPSSVTTKPAPTVEWLAFKMRAMAAVSSVFIQDAYPRWVWLRQLLACYRFGLVL
jgi:hypothetical protein